MSSLKWRYGLLTLVLCCFMSGNLLLAQTTGKITGKVTEAETGEPLIGANVQVVSTTLGAATDLNGEFYIINVPPGKYNVLIRMIGYEAVRTEIRVSVNRTSTVKAVLKPTILEGQEVTIVASKIATKKDQTSSIKNVSSDQISNLPVESVDEVIQMQAGVVGGHFRGGRLNEVSYLIDGMQVNETFYGERSTIQLEKEVVQDLEVITGTFNAEYGKAMSGIVNMVTKDGADVFHGSASTSLGNYLTTHDQIFPGIKASDVARIQDYKIMLEGPIWKNRINFLTNIRYEKDLGHLNGIRRFNVDNYSNFNETNIAGEYATPWDAYIRGARYYSEHTGDSAFVPLNDRESLSLFGKLSIKPCASMKIALTYSLDKDDWQGYSHGWKYNPDGLPANHTESALYALKVNHTLGRSAFHELKISYTDNWSGRYLYEDPFDSRYLSTQYGGSVGGFSAGGQSREHAELFTKLYEYKYDLTWQVSKHHSLKTGFQYTQHWIKNWPVPVRDKKYNSPLLSSRVYDPVTQRMIFTEYEPELLPEEAIEMDRYIKEPFDYSIYLQDKMEYDELVINLGLRYDNFNSNTVYPSNRRNPANQGYYEDPNMMSQWLEAKPQVQLSPRFGLSYTLSNAAVLHFSYGHFFQMPPLYSLYSNYRFLIPTGDFGTTHGNPLIKAQKTVKYEMGLWQELMPGLGLDVSVYYSDIYDLQSAVVWTTYNEIRYGVYDNKDYGNTKGLEVKIDYDVRNVQLTMNYTLQYTRGNADNPNSTYDRMANNVDPVPKLIAMSWDQRHTLNLNVGYTQANYSLSLSGFFNSGFPYNYSPIPQSRLAKQNLLPNNGKRPSNYYADLQGYYDFPILGNKKLRLYLTVKNLFDQLSELGVNSYTGRAYNTILHPTEEQVFRSNFNTILDQYENPAMYAPPREVKLGLGFIF
ncbi:TonB-dependent receptor [candidate division KSB1 bacterium]|nr:TonB-dependent receptor [candidate division KSB1 bacterium]